MSRRTTLIIFGAGLLAVIGIGTVVRYREMKQAGGIAAFVQGTPVFGVPGGTGGGAVAYYDWMPGSPAMQTTASFGNTANAQNATGFTSPTTATYTKLTYTINTIDNSANLYAIGWANSSGTVICGSGAIAGTTFAPSVATFTVTMSPTCSFTAGSKYYLIWTGQATTMKFAGTPVGSFLRQGNVGATTNAVLTNFTPPADTFGVSVNQTPWVDMHN